MLRSAVHRVVPGHRRWQLRTWTLSTPVLNDVYVRANPLLRTQRVTSATTLLIDGFPRSGNGFGSYALRELLGQDARISALSHAPRSFHRAARLGVPAALLIRDPDAVISSLITYDPTQTEITGFRSWIRFHEQLIQLLPHLVVADFETLTTDLPELVRRLNSSFGLGISLTAARDLRAEEIFSAIDRRGDELLASGLLDAARLAARSSRPMETRHHRHVARDDAPWTSLRCRAWAIYRKIVGGW